jgi:UDP-2,4-diacetamido-2,4,6-trideoxy-beta-L-altropyranose hydrolase/UDP-4-amino-4,6-dideoxy-N-acetyl-beta-L-altrosamine N-acetyltransferase
MVNDITVVFRVDASLAIGSGHVMRCLALAQAVHAQGGVCIFLCRQHKSNLINTISEAGFKIYALSVSRDNCEVDSRCTLAHSHWLGETQEGDACECIPILDELQAQWLVVDHYGLDCVWESLVANHVGSIMVIDDLADREHCCNLLLDQNLGRKAADYESLVPPGCTILTGPIYALLRPEFLLLRAESLQRRKTASLNSIVVAMGGVDAPDATSKVLAVLNRCTFSSRCTRITVIMGALAPALSRVQDAALAMRYPTQVLVNIDNVGAVMAASDLAIGAVGGSAWERCALGLPTIMVVLAENQRLGAVALAAGGAGVLLGEVDEIELKLPVLIGKLDCGGNLHDLSVASSMLTDGQGVYRVVNHILCSRDNVCRGFGLIRSMCMDDLHDVWQWRNHSDVRQYMLTQQEISWAEHLAWFSIASTDPTRHLLIYEFGGRATGFVSFTQRGIGGIADWGFYLAPGSGKGMGRKLGKTALDHAFQQLNLHKVSGQSLGFNERSIRLHQSLGFVQEGILRDQHFDGTRYHDIFSFGLISHEWRSAREEFI